MALDPQIPPVDPQMPPNRFWRVRIDPECEERLESTNIPADQSRTLALLIIRLGYCAGDMPIVDEGGRRVIDMRFTILLGDGSEMSPLSVFFTVKGDEALVVDVEPINEAAAIHVAATAFVEMLMTVYEALRRFPPK
jgi:hypothetical protein